MNKKKASIIISIVIVALAIGIGIYRFSSKNKLAEDNKVLSENSEIEDSDKDDNEVKEESTDQSKEDSKDEDLAKEEKKEESDKKAEEEKKILEQEEETQQKSSNTSSDINKNAVNTNNNTSIQANTPPVQEQPQQTATPTYTIGIDNSMTSQIRSLYSEAQTYTGNKTGTFRGMTEKLARGEISSSNVQGLAGTTWQEDLNSTAFKGRYEINISQVTSNSFNMPANSTAADVSFSNKAVRGNFTDLVAYRNSDGSYTIYAIGINFLFRKI